MIHRIFTTGLLLAGLSSTVLASDGRNAGSLLLYPEFDNTPGRVTIGTVTNVEVGAEATDIDVHFRYIGKYDAKGQPIGCLEFNRTETLTPADTFTFVTNAHNPEHEQGYFFAYAERYSEVTQTQNPVKHNYLVGNLITVDGIMVFEYSVNPVAYLGIREGETTDVDGDGLLDLDNREYSASPDEILIPRFIGQGHGYNSELILIALTGGTQFDTTIDFLIFNDNEEIFSSEHTFNCWERVHLLDISFIFLNDFLKNWTNHDPLEVFGAPRIETGWIRIVGAQANSGHTTIMDPSVYAMLLERIGRRGAADLPFERGKRTNGELLSHDIRGRR